MSRLTEAAAARAQGVQQRSHRPQQRRASEEPTSRGIVRATIGLTEVREMQRNGFTVVPVGGLASTYEEPYEMYDWFGPYTEVVRQGAAAQTLATSPLVEFTCNHGAGGGLPMAHTRNDTLALAELDAGLDYTAYVDPQRRDVADMLRALERGDLADASFRFRITAGQWSPDYTEYSINAFDLERGDVSAVNFGANPHASSGLRAAPVVMPLPPAQVQNARARALLELALAE